LATGALSATTIGAHFGASPKASGHAPMGLSAALWDIGHKDRSEVARPGYPDTNVISIWTRGATHSDLYIDGVRRFSQMRGTGSFQMARAGESLRAMMTKASGECLDIYLPTAVVDLCLAKECEKASASFEFLPLKVERDPEITRIAAAVSREITAPGIASQMALDAATLSLTVTLIRRWSNQKDQIRQPRTALAPWQVRRALERLEACLTEDISLDDLAREVGLSPFHFARSFKAAVGAPPHRHQIALRLERARKLLETTDLSVRDIAERTGYSDPSYFARGFGKMFGIAPLQYRRQQRA
jgi:AraC family transcriptional regulator